MRLRKLEKARKLVTTLLVAALVAAVAYTVSGLVTRHLRGGLQLTSGTGFKITSSVDLAYPTCTPTTATSPASALYPGVPRCLVISVHDTLHVKIHVTSLAITTETFTSATTDPSLAGCAVSTLTGPSSLTQTFTVTPGTTYTVKRQIELKNTSVNQDNCEQGKFNFSYQADATFTDKTVTVLSTGVPNPSSYGQTVTFTAKVTADDAAFDTVPLSGTVKFVKCTTHACTGATTTLGTEPINSTPSSPTYGKAVLQYSELPHGKSYIEAIYEGTTNYTGSPSQVVSQGVTTTATSTHLGTGSPNPAAPGQTVTFTATVTPVTGRGTPAGVVSLYECKTTACTTLAATPLQTETLSAEKATFSVSFPTTGTYELKAKFTSATTTEFANSGSNVVTEKVTYAFVCISTTINGGYTVTVGKTVYLCGRVNGGVKVKTHATLIVEGATINGGITSTNASALRFCKSTVNGGVTANKTGGFVFIGDAKPHDDSPTCTGNTINGGVTISNGTGGFEVGGDTISGGLSLLNNKTPTKTASEDSPNEVEGNTITGGITCTTNKPVPTDGGKANSVTGKVSGQCTGTGF